MSNYINKEKWKLQKTLMIIQLLVSPFIGLYMIWYRDWNTLKPSSVANVSVDVICMVILIFLFMYTVKDQSDNSLRTGYFASLISLNSLALLGDVFCWSVDGIPELRAVNLLANTFFYFLGIIMSMVFWGYLVELSETNSPRLKALTGFFQCCGAIAGVAVFYNIKGRYYFDIDSSGSYFRGKLYPVSSAFLVIMLIIFAVLIFCMNMDRRKKAALATFVSVPVVAFILQLIFYGSSLVYVGTLLSLFMIYGYVFSEQNEELAKQKWENTRKEQEILLAKQKQQLIEADLNLAAEIQKRVLPRTFPESEAFSMCASMTPAKEVGGDFYDFFYVDADHLALVIADVSGKGIPAALYMMTAKTMIKNAATQGMEPDKLLEFVNRQLCENSDEAPMFVTVWIGILEISTGTLKAANAGHEYPAICRRDGNFQLFKDRHGLVLGGMEGLRYRQYELHLDPGDTLFVYTDGVTEATDLEDKLFGTDNMLKTLNIDPHAEPSALLAQTYRSLDAFVGQGNQFDDITMMAIKMSEPEMMTKTINVIPTEESMGTVQAMAEELMDEAMVPMKVAMKISIAIDEIYSNIIQYSQAKNADITCRASSQAIEILFMDDGVPYNPLENEDPDITLSAEERESGGLGIFITKNIMDTIDYAYTDGKNLLRVTKKL